MMRAIIFDTQKEAETANKSLSILLSNEVEFVGSGEFEQPRQKEYSYIIKHSTQNKWALISNEEIESFLNKSSIELTNEWFDL